MNFDLDFYTITVRKEDVDGDVFYVGRVAEFPNLCAYENSYDEALAVVRGAINSIKMLADEAGENMPEQLSIAENEFSGRVTLRLPKSLHAQVDRLAVNDGVSLNQYLVAAIASHAGQVSGTLTATNAINMALDRVLKHSFLLVENAFEVLSKTGSHEKARQLSSGTTYRTAVDYSGVTGNACYIQ
jgi:predicted RNase H-like HicB family nuclease